VSPDAGAEHAQARAERIVAGMRARDEFSRWLGLEVVELAPARCRCRMRIRPEMANGFGVAHGGVVFALADSALAFASNTHGRVTLSIENGISYPAPSRPGDTLDALATEESAGGRIAFYRVLVTNQKGDPVALFRGTVYRTSDEHGA
jgi:acyl-CoA thioesterase